MDNSLSVASLSGIALSTEAFYRPRISPGDATAVESGFTYETRHARGRGYVHLRKDDQGAWRAQTLGMIVLDLKGHEEAACIDADWERGDRTWGEYAAERRARVEAQPYVLIGLSRADACRVC